MERDMTIKIMFKHLPAAHKYTQVGAKQKYYCGDYRLPKFIWSKL